MSTHKNIDRICIFAVILALLISIVFMNGEALGIQVQATQMGYENRLFDTSYVHTIDIEIDDWDAFLQTCQSEEYSVCSVTIDGERYANVGIRGKGNTSLSTVSSMDSDRYSFKIEFDQYDSSNNYYGLDKLSLNNLIQDNTYMKDYLTYQMMNQFGVAAPLCSYVYITVNGEDWGLYLAVESVEESFLQRNYGSDYGELYKPDSMDMGGGRGNGMDFNMEDIMEDFTAGNGTNMPSEQVPDSTEVSEPPDEPAAAPETASTTAEKTTLPEEVPQDPNSADSNGQMPEMPGAGDGNMQMPEMPGSGDGDTQMPEMPDSGDGGMQMPEMPDSGDGSMQMPEAPDSEGNATPPPETTDAQENDTQPDTADDTAQAPQIPTGEDSSIQMPEDFDPTSMGSGRGQGGGFGGDMGGGMGSSDVKLQYIDDDPSSYSSIFDNAKTDITSADQERLIDSLQILSTGQEVSSVVNVDAVIRYFVVHNFVVNADSYTGSMIHNYYLYEEDGVLSMIPWDYNLAFGTFQGNDASGAVNDDIDAPLSVTSGTDRPMIAWIFSNAEYTELYHQYFEEFLNSVDIDAIIDSAVDLIAPYVEQDPTKFCTYEEFETGVATLKTFCSLRSESVSNQLSGDDTIVDASSISLSDMGTMNQGGSMNLPGTGDTGMQIPGQPVQNSSADTQTSAGTTIPEGMELPEGMEIPEGMEMPEGVEMPEGMQMPSGMQMPADMTNMELPEGMDDMQMPEEMANMTGNPSQPTGSSTQSSSLILLGVSAAVLLLGLLIAFKFKH